MNEQINELISYYKIVANIASQNLQVPQQEHEQSWCLKVQQRTQTHPIRENNPALFQFKLLHEPATSGNAMMDTLTQVHYNFITPILFCFLLH